MTTTDSSSLTSVVAHLRQLLAQATPSPWDWETLTRAIGADRRGGNASDLALMFALVNAAPVLLAEVERGREEVERGAREAGRHAAITELAAEADAQASAVPLGERFGSGYLIGSSKFNALTFVGQFIRAQRTTIGEEPSPLTPGGPDA